MKMRSIVLTYLYDSALDDDPPCGTMPSNIWEDKNYIDDIYDPFCSLDEKYFCGDSSGSYIVEFASNACNYYEREGNKIPLYFLTISEMQALFFICIGYHKLVVVIYSCTNFQCELNFKVARSMV